jgi:hypothetical protein
VGAQTAGWKGEIWNVPTFLSKMGFTSFGPTTGNPFLFALDTDNFICAVRDDINMKVFSEGVISDGAGVVLLNLMQQDAKALRVTFRMAWAAANPVTRLQPDRTQRYPASVLVQGATPVGLVEGENEGATALAGDARRELADTGGTSTRVPTTRETNREPARATERSGRS